MTNTQEYSQAYWKKNKVVMAARQKIWAYNNRTWVNERQRIYMRKYRAPRQEVLNKIREVGCACGGPGEDLHHVKFPKMANPAQLLWNGQFAAFVRELRKCVVICKRCHGKIHG